MLMCLLGTLKPESKPRWFDFGFASIIKIEGKQLKQMNARNEMMNGLEWSLDDNTLIFMDSRNYQLYFFNYDSKKDKLGM